MNIQKNIPSCRIKKVEITNEKITGRGGLPIFLRYVDSIGILPLFKNELIDIRKSKKGQPVESIIRQVVAFMADGSSSSIISFDEIKKDEGYAAALECSRSELISSHTVRRFFQNFTSSLKSNRLRKILKAEFIRQVRATTPEQITLDIDTMVLDNSESDRRHGVKPTYKKGVKGFQNLQVTWNGILVDALFRNGSAHSNHGDDVLHILRNVINTIRKGYRQDVPITITMDSGFFSEENLVFLSEEMNVTFIAMGKMYDDLREKVKLIPTNEYSLFEGKRKIWTYTEFNDKRESWKRTTGFRVVHTCLLTDDNGQAELDFIREDSLIYTNSKTLSCKDIITLAHNRGRSELTNRSFKEFMTTETLPFKNFGMNTAWYFIMAISHSLFVGFRNEILAVVKCVSDTANPTTIRRQVFDIAAKVIRKGTGFILKFPSGVYNRLNIEKLWEQVNIKLPSPTIIIQ